MLQTNHPPSLFEAEVNIMSVWESDAATAHSESRAKFSLGI